MPSVSSLCMNSIVAALAKGDQVVLIIGTPLCKQKYVMHFLHRNRYPFLKAKLTEGMLLHIGIADDLPVPSVSPLCRSAITTILFILRVPFLLMLLSVPASSTMLSVAFALQTLLVGCHLSCDNPVTWLFQLI